MRASLPSRVTVVGIGADGWNGLGDAVRTLLGEAPVVIGATRQLALLPRIEGQRRSVWPSPFDVHVLEEDAGREVVVLASGDPFLSGIATTLLPLVGDRMVVVPAVSSTTLARARMLWSAEETVAVSVVGRRIESVARELTPGRRILVLSADECTPSVVAALLVEAGFGASTLTVLGDLGSDHESRTDGTAAGWGEARGPRLNVIAIDCVGPIIGSWAPGLPDDAYEHDGQLTKRDLRASALARLAPQPGQRLWDVGAGAGSVGIEWMRTHRRCRAIAFERDAVRAARVAANAATLGVPDLRVVVGEAPHALVAAQAPHAVFVGGGATTPGLLDLCMERLLGGGRLVVHGVTLETGRELAERFDEHGGELTRISVETAAPIGAFTGWTPARAVMQWAWTKP